MNQEAVDCIISIALREDLISNPLNFCSPLDEKQKASFQDVTTGAIFSKEQGKAFILAKSRGVLSGARVVERVYFMIDPDIKVKFLIDDGSFFKPGSKAAEISGKISSILMGERTALNFLGHLSGVATEVNGLIKILDGTQINILDTRKTLPGMRMLEKQAVVHGGGKNHRMGLYDMVLIKDNHIDGAGSITEAVKRVREVHGKHFKIEVEARNLREVKEALEAGADRIMLDNMNRSMIKKACSLIGKRSEIELSGNMTPRRIKKLKKIKANFISCGYITSSACHSDFSMKLIPG